jgi:AcrB/AcrD/AcrF family
MVLLFLRDWRSVLVVVLNIPLAVMGALVALWATGQTINLMTRGGLALAVGILVDEATVEVENINSQLDHTDSVAEAVRREMLRPPSRGCWPCFASWPSSCRSSPWRGRLKTCSCLWRWPSAFP